MGAEHEYSCAVEVALEAIGPKWSVVVLALVKEEPRRYSDLARLLPEISDKVLTERLRALESEGLIDRSVGDQSPPHVTYSLAEGATGIVPALEALFAWGEARAAERGLTIRGA